MDLGRPKSLHRRGQEAPSASHGNGLKRRERAEGAKFVRYFGPLLDALRKLGGSAKPEEAWEQIASDLKLSDDVQNELMSSGKARFPNQVQWARFYLAREGLIDSSKRGVWSLTERGRATHLSAEAAREIFLRSVKEFQQLRRAPAADEPEIVERDVEPVAATKSDYRGDVIELLLALPPSGFERLAQRLLREAGFTQVIVTRKSGDEGIDGYGTLQINPMLSFKVLFQCKRLRKSVSSPQVRDFRGAMAGRADKGIIITTGTFTTDARKEAGRDGVPPIDLIDGEKLVDMLQSLELGLKPITTYEVDRAFFDEFAGEN